MLLLLLPKKKVTVGTSFRRWLATKLMDIAVFLDTESNEQKLSLKPTDTPGKPSSKRSKKRTSPRTMQSETLDLLEFLETLIMTSEPDNQYYGPPPPVVELTLEQQFKMRQIEDALKNPETRKEDIITVFMALQRQCFVLGNNVSNLVKQWGKPTTTDLDTIIEDLSKFGISSETKD